MSPSFIIVQLPSTSAEVRVPAPSRFLFSTGYSVKLRQSVLADLCLMVHIHNAPCGEPLQNAHSKNDLFIYLFIETD
jgi:hypothetical protein